MFLVTLSILVPPLIVSVPKSRTSMVNAIFPTAEYPLLAANMFAISFAFIPNAFINAVFLRSDSYNAIDVMLPNVLLFLDIILLYFSLSSSEYFASVELSESSSSSSF